MEQPNIYHLNFTKYIFQVNQYISNHRILKKYCPLKEINEWGCLTFEKSIEKCIAVGQKYSVSFQLQLFLSYQGNITELWVIPHVIIQGVKLNWNPLNYLSQDPM